MKWFEKYLVCNNLHYNVVWPPIMKEDHQIMKWHFKKEWFFHVQQHQISSKTTQ